MLSPAVELCQLAANKGLEMVALINPANGRPLTQGGDALIDEDGTRFPIVAGVPRIGEVENYTASFGTQWNLFASTQIDRNDAAGDASARRLFAETAWPRGGLDGLDVLEVGSGAGRFSTAILRHTAARLWSVDYSSAVEANQRLNGAVGPDRFRLFQASIYEMPFPDNSFDKVLCIGVLQHTPDFARSIRTLVAKAKPGGEIVVDFYPIKGFWTKINAKYLLRPVTKRLSHQKLLGLIESNVDWLMWVSDALQRVRLGKLRRFLPLCDINDTLPPCLSAAERREWVVLDTFDQYSPAHDHPQRLDDVAAMFRVAGATVDFAGFIDNGSGSAAVVRATKRAR